MKDPATEVCEAVGRLLEAPDMEACHSLWLDLRAAHDAWKADQEIRRKDWRERLRALLAR